MAERTLLIVENNRLTREGLVKTLAQAGYPVSQAANGQEALDQLQARSSAPALMLLDMFMPVMDGWTLLRQSRKMGLPLPPFIIVTGLEIATEEWARGLGAVGLLVKPFDVDQLLTEVREHC
jgi:CheY-like chemotaxis protein